MMSSKLPAPKRRTKDIDASSVSWRKVVKSLLDDLLDSDTFLLIVAVYVIGTLLFSAYLIIAFLGDFGIVLYNQLNYRWSLLISVVYAVGVVVVLSLLMWIAHDVYQDRRKQILEEKAER